MKKSEAGTFHFLPCPHLEERTTPICCELASLSRLLQLLSFHPRDPYPSMTSGGGFGVTAKALSTTSSNETKSAAETAAAVKKFTALGVCEQLAEAAAALGWTAPTEIQAAAVPHLLAGTACEEKEEREGEREREREREKERAGHSTSRRRLASPPPPSAFLLSLLLFALPLAHLVPFHTTIPPFGTNRQGRHRPRADRERQDGRLRPAHSSGKRMTHASLFFPQAKHRAAATAPTSDRNLLLPPFPPLSTPSHPPPPPPNDTK